MTALTPAARPYKPEDGVDLIARAVAISPEFGATITDLVAQFDHLVTGLALMENPTAPQKELAEFVRTFAGNIAKFDAASAAFHKAAVELQEQASHVTVPAMAYTQHFKERMAALSR